MIRRSTSRACAASIRLGEGASLVKDDASSRASPLCRTALASAAETVAPARDSPIRSRLRMLFSPVSSPFFTPFE